MAITRRALTRASSEFRTEIISRAISVINSRLITIIASACSVLYVSFWAVALLQNRGIIQTKLPIPVADEAIIERSHLELVPQAISQQDESQRTELIQEALAGPSAPTAMSPLTLDIEATAPVDLRVVDAQGNSTGLDPLSHSPMLNIADGSYSGRSNPQLVSIRHATGTYRVQLAGSQTGSYTLTVRLMADNDTAHALQYSGTGEVFQDTVLQATVTVAIADGQPRLTVSSVEALTLASAGLSSDQVDNPAESLSRIVVRLNPPARLPIPIPLPGVDLSSITATFPAPTAIFPHVAPGTLNPLAPADGTVADAVDTGSSRGEVPWSDDNYGGTQIDAEGAGSFSTVSQAAGPNLNPAQPTLDSPSASSNALSDPPSGLSDSSPNTPSAVLLQTDASQSPFPSTSPSPASTTSSTSTSGSSSSTSNVTPASQAGSSQSPVAISTPSPTSSTSSVSSPSPTSSTSSVSTSSPTSSTSSVSSPSPTSSTSSVSTPSPTSSTSSVSTPTAATAPASTISGSSPTSTRTTSSGGASSACSNEGSDGSSGGGGTPRSATGSAHASAAPGRTGNRGKSASAPGHSNKRK